MHFAKINTLCFLLPCLLSISNNTSAQEQKDTIYFDNEWSICEKPVAEYYRIGTLNKAGKIYYKDSARDYFINGALEMSGYYDDNGRKQGKFFFYSQQGIILKEGSFENDLPKGNWKYYNQKGQLRMELDVYDNINFTPQFIVKNNGDTILKNGTGKFMFHSKKDFPDIFAPVEDFIVEGEVSNGKKNGMLRYTDADTKNEFVITEFYADDIFKKGNWKTGAGNENSNSPSLILFLKSFPFDRIDRFYHTNIVFGNEQQAAEQKVVNLLLYNITPEIASHSINFDGNRGDISDILSSVFYKSCNKEVFKNIHAGSSIDSGTNVLIAITDTSLQPNNFPEMHAGIIVTIDTSGYVVNTSFQGNLPKKMIDEINYYLSRLSGLKPFELAGDKLLSNLSFNLCTITDTVTLSKGQVITYSGYFSSYSNNIDILRTKVAKFYREPRVQIEAKFPGGAAAWQKYLEKNLNSNVPVELRAPNGIYTVLVSFLVDNEGKISEVEALNNPGYGTAEEAVRVIKNGPNWVPAVQDGKSVIYRQKQSITFMVSGG